MHTDIAQLLYKAEDTYLENQDVALYRYNVASMAESLEAYEMLRDREVHVFQLMADELEETFPTASRAELEDAIKQWVLILRYCAMAMLLNNPEYLTLRLSNWFKDILQFRTLAEMDNTLYQLLLENLEDIMTEKHYDRIKPFLSQVKTSLLEQLSVPNLAAANV